VAVFAFFRLLENLARVSSPWGNSAL